MASHIRLMPRLSGVTNYRPSDIEQRQGFQLLRWLDNKAFGIGLTRLMATNIRLMPKLSGVTNYRPSDIEQRQGFQLLRWLDNKAFGIGLTRLMATNIRLMPRLSEGAEGAVSKLYSDCTSPVVTASRLLCAAEPQRQSPNRCVASTSMVSDLAAMLHIEPSLRGW